ncbi:glycosyltransferase family 9 protein [Microbacterium trichothecenolyticum]|uniref:ADP-heptose:LPS heptosyltransferase n=1 Tax=Microbacterium trichothecenolyticum TaxID=69370 RepID=A0ABU0TSK3_MICTR|nr:glycosyltransferase family 9 protein [Microbacterium trichothecenolyticum]MDQ1122609.1 ADP-heptose:LPS heptosyltransferase [Microbacterium trichothecenolyticum]
MTRVLVARLDSLGDVLLCGPAVRAIAAAPDVDEVWMLCSSVGADAARALPGVDEVLVWDSPWITVTAPPATPAHLAVLAALLERASVDAAVILTSFHQSPLPLALQLRLAGVAFIAAASVDHAGTLLDVHLKPGEDFPEDQPEPIRALGIAAAAGFILPGDDDGRLRMRLDAPPPTALTGLGPYVVVHPGAAATARQWPAASHARAVRLLHGAGVQVVVTGGPDERELTARVSGEGHRALDLGGETRLPVLAATLAGASVAVVGNTGPAHIAAAVGTPVVSLFSPVVPAARWAPYGVPHVLLGDQWAPCRNSRARECPVAGHPCLASVSPHEVVAAVFALAPALARQEVGA